MKEVQKQTTFINQFLALEQCYLLFFFLLVIMKIKKEIKNTTKLLLYKLEISKILTAILAIPIVFIVLLSRQKLDEKSSQSLKIFEIR